MWWPTHRECDSDVTGKQRFLNTDFTVRKPHRCSYTVHDMLKGSAPQQIERLYK